MFSKGTDWISHTLQLYCTLLHRRHLGCARKYSNHFLYNLIESSWPPYVRGTDIIPNVQARKLTNSFQLKGAEYCPRSQAIESPFWDLALAQPLIGSVTLLQTKLISLHLLLSIYKMGIITGLLWERNMLIHENWQYCLSPQGVSINIGCIQPSIISMG